MSIVKSTHRRYERDAFSKRAVLSHERLQSGHTADNFNHVDDSSKMLQVATRLYPPTRPNSTEVIGFYAGAAEYRLGATQSSH